MKKTFLTILVFALSFTFSFAQSGGDGTSGDPYQISTYADLQWLQTATTEWIADKNFVQTANINAAATATDGWNPIGNDVFAGSYDGGGFAIDSLTINGSSYVGFIQKTSSTTIIKNLGLTNVSVTATGGYGAALVTFMDGGTVENCYSTGNIISNATDVNYNYAGLIARMNAGTVSDSYSEADISYLNFAPENVGGFVGYYTGSITNCYATGNVQGGKSVGGFVGNLHSVADITKCYSTGDVTASGSPSGGFMGYNIKGAVSECYSTGNVSGDQRSGGFVGMNRKAQGVISNCYSFGNVTGTVGKNVGGFCGWNYQSATIKNSYSIGVSNDQGFLGTNDGTVTACFFDSTASGSTDTLATAKTTSEMQTASTFADASWDLTSIWKVEGNYPNLINNENSDLEPLLSVPAGSGTEDDPYQIATLKNLAWLTQTALPWIKNHVQTADIDASETATWDSEDDNGDGNKFNDPNDLTTDGSNDGWMPIGGEFRGVYDGGGFVIDGLTMNNSTDNLGLFKTITKGTIKNLGLTNVNITGLSYLGGLTGTSYGNSVDNCYVTGTITSDNAHKRIGGLIGFAGGGDIDHVISNCYADVEIVGAGDFSGGFIGNIKKAQSATITNCYALGNTSGSQSIGGFIGKLEASGPILVDNCYSTGNAVGKRYTGGFVGDIRKDVTITNSYSLGNVTEPEGVNSKQLGGFTGAIVDATVKNSYSTGSIRSTYLDANSVVQDHLKNGFVAYQHGTVTDCFFDKETSNRDSSVTALGKTTSEMMTESTFTNWDFASIWEIKGNYPNLIENSNPNLVPIEVIKEIVGKWDFNDPSYLGKATVGEDLEIFGAPTAVAGPTDNDGAVLVGVGDYFKAVTNLAQVGEDGRADTYTFQTDIKMPEVGQYNALLQVRTPNTSDATIFVYPAKSIGKSSYGISKPVIEAETWYRIIFSVEELKDINKFGINLYVNGARVVGDSTQNLSSWISMADSVLFFTDNNGEVMPTDVSQIVLYNYALSSEEAAELATPFKKEEVQDPLPKGTELIANYGFNDALNGWNFFSKDVGYADYSLDATGVINGPNSVKVNVDTTYNSYPSGRISLYTGVPIETGKKYYLTFKIKSNKVINDKAIWWSMYDSLKANSYYNGMWGQVTLDKDTTVKYEATFTADFTDATTDFSIDFAAIPNDSTTMWLDDIHLIKLAEPEPSGARSLSFNLGATRNEYLIAKDTLNFGLDSTWTMEGWFKFANFDAAGGEDHLMRLGAQLFVDGSNSLKVQAGGNYVAGTTELVTDKWYHIAYVRTLSNVTVYLDGVEEIVAAGADAGAEADRFLIGSYGTPSESYNFAGNLDEIRLWNVARTEAEINAAKEVELTGAEDGLVIYYNFNDGSDSTVVNIAGENYNGELFNMADSNWSKDNPFERPIPPDELPLPEGTELLTNNYFNDGLTNWDLNLSVQSAATLVLDNSGALESDNSAKVHVKSTYSSGSWKNQFRQTEMEGSLVKGNSYHVQFQIKANKAVSGIYAVVQQNHGSFSDVYSKEISLLADSMVTVVDTFVCAETDSMVTWAFNLGTASVKDVDIWFDAVHLIDVGELVGVEEETTLPKVYALQQNYPNPFNPTTVINFALPKASDVHLSVYNILGQKVTELVNSKMVAGNHSVNFNATHLASGVYIYRIKAGNFVSVKKMLLLK